jgi:hypothetical protein
MGRHLSEISRLIFFWGIFSMLGSTTAKGHVLASIGGWLVLCLLAGDVAAQEVRHYRGTCTNVTARAVAPVAIDMRLDSQSIGGELRIAPPLMGSGSFSGTRVNGTCRGLSVTGIQFSGACNGTSFNPVYVVSGQTGYCTTHLIGPAAPPPQKQPAPVVAKRPSPAPAPPPSATPSPAPPPPVAAAPAPTPPPDPGFREQ